MKRLIVLLLFVVISYGAFTDLTEGTLHYLSSQPQIENSITTTTESTYFEYTVKNGEMLITIMERHLNSSIPVSIDTLINDFKKLNNGMEPTSIQPGKTYLFPNYKQMGI